MEKLQQVKEKLENMKSVNEQNGSTVLDSILRNNAQEIVDQIGNVSRSNQEPVIFPDDVKQFLIQLSQVLGNSVDEIDSGDIESKKEIRKEQYRKLSNQLRDFAESLDLPSSKRIF